MDGLPFLFVRLTLSFGGISFPLDGVTLPFGGIPFALCGVTLSSFFVDSYVFQDKFSFVDLAL